MPDVIFIETKYFHLNLNQSRQGKEVARCDEYLQK